MLEYTFCSYLQIIYTVYLIKFEILDLSIFSVYGRGSWSSASKQLFLRRVMSLVQAHPKLPCN